jgi:hypothetical protein
VLSLCTERRCRPSGVVRLLRYRDLSHTPRTLLRSECRGTHRRHLYYCIYRTVDNACNGAGLMARDVRKCAILAT